MIEDYSPMIRVWLVRHAPVDLPYIYGQMDVEANLEDVAAFGFLKAVLPKNAVAYSSDLKRCQRTAELAGFEFTSLLPQFREQHFGDWQGLLYDEALERDPDFYWHFWEKPAETTLPNGESLIEVSKRVWTCLEKLLHENPDEDDLVVFCHAGVIRTILAGALSIPLSASLKFNIDPLSVSQVTCYRTTDQLEFDVGFVNRIKLSA